jgi:hypothetical protein
MRTNLCMQTFDNYEKIKESKLPVQYYNKFFKKNMDLKVCDFFWASSRKSYLPCGQTCDVYSYDAIRACLLAGARLINLDIYADKDGKTPVVRDKIPMPEFMSGLKTNLDVEKCFKIVKNYAWIHSPTYPLVLHLNINMNNKVVMLNLAKILNSVFKGHFLNKRYSFSGRNGQFPFGQIPIKEMMGRVAIITNVYPTIGVLDEFINGSVRPGQKFINEITYTPSMQQYGGLLSKHSNITNMINNNRFNLTFINSALDYETGITHNSECVVNQNFRNPKSDLYNADAEDCWKLGCQFVMMNYQLFDDNMKKYMEKFKNSSLVLKPEKLRYIPQPKKPVVQQNKNASYAPRKIMDKGWFSYNI